MNSSKNYLVPGAIIVVGILIAGALVYGGNNNGNNRAVTGHQGLPNTQGIEGVREVTEDDHVKGNPDAQITIIEYSDFECPFCGRFHPTLARVIEENKDVRWVYRHFPLTSIHSRAQRAAVASECVANLGGNDSFWSFADTLFENQRQLGDELYSSEVARLGLNEGEFQTCLSDKDVAGEVTADNNEAVQSGGRGTPFSILITKSGEMVSFSGALPYEQVTALVEQARAN